jgi:hypothetical protein
MEVDREMPEPAPFVNSNSFSFTEIDAKTNFADI